MYNTYATTRKDLQMKVCNQYSTFLGLARFAADAYHNDSFREEKLIEAYDAIYETLAEHMDFYDFVKCEEKSYGFKNPVTESSCYMFGIKGEKLTAFEVTNTECEDFNILMLRRIREDDGFVTIQFYAIDNFPGKHKK